MTSLPTPTPGGSPTALPELRRRIVAAYEQLASDPSLTPKQRAKAARELAIWKAARA